MRGNLASMSAAAVTCARSSRVTGAVTKARHAPTPDSHVLGGDRAGRAERRLDPGHCLDPLRRILPPLRRSRRHRAKRE